MSRRPDFLLSAFSKTRSPSPLPYCRISKKNGYPSPQRERRYAAHGEGGPGHALTVLTLCPFLQGAPPEWAHQSIKA